MGFSFFFIIIIPIVRKEEATMESSLFLCFLSIFFPVHEFIKIYHITFNHVWWQKIWLYKYNVLSQTSLHSIKISLLEGENFAIIPLTNLTFILIFSSFIQPKLSSLAMPSASSSSKIRRSSSLPPQRGNVKAQIFKSFYNFIMVSLTSLVKLSPTKKLARGSCNG